MMGLEEIKEANRDPQKFYRSRLSAWEEGNGDRRNLRTVHFVSVSSAGKDRPRKRIRSGKRLAGVLR